MTGLGMTGHAPGRFEPSSRVVMIGAGQLARMTHQAAIDYGIVLHVLASTVDDPAVTAGAEHTIGDPDDFADLAVVARRGAVVTFDHELVPPDNVRRLEEGGHVVRPGSSALRFAQDKLHARLTLAALDDPPIPVPAFAPASSVADVVAFADRYGWPVVLKARGGGYDGRGVHVLAGPGDARGVLPDAAGDVEPSWVVEEHLDLAAELAVLVARRPSGEVATYPPIGTFQLDGMCRELTMPAPVSAEVAGEAVRLAESVVARIDAYGICAVELFLTTGGRLLLNELALRPHNSGHATIEACATSQFHQHLRAVLDWPLGPTALYCPAATVNLVGGPSGLEVASRLPLALQVPGAHVHLYAKASRPGRKIGHVTAVADRLDDALETARAAASLLTGA